MNIVVTVLDTTGIQPYIFGSNRLRENVGASYLVAQVTDSWVKEVLIKLQEQNNWETKIPDYKKPEEKPHIEENDLMAELVYAGGGNTVLLFKTLELAKEFTKRLSKKILEEAPGISLVAAHKEFDWNNTEIPLYAVIQDVMQNDIDRAKQNRINSSPLLGLSVTAACRSTQLVAVGMSNEAKHKMPSEQQPYPISREISTKLTAVEQANKQLEYFIFDDPKKPKRYEIPLDIDDMGRSEGESSYIAIVHADGNNMGKRFQEVGKGKANREYITEVRRLCDSIKEAGKEALKKVTQVIIEAYDSGLLKDKLHLKGKKLPFRPIVYGGDDVTFICDGRLGLELAAIYLEEFEKQSVSYGGKLRACAGVCIVKSHYPFARAYQLSEALCKSAKKYAKDKAVKKGVDFSAIDWHLATSGLIGSIGDIREREYQGVEGNLAMRPVLLLVQDDEWRTWQSISKVIHELNDGEQWKDKRNKVIALREILRKGENATKEYLTAYNLGNLPLFSECSTQLAESGWADDSGKRICGYFDAIEAMEFYFPLKEIKSDE